MTFHFKSFKTHYSINLYNDQFSFLNFHTNMWVLNSPTEHYTATVTKIPTG